MRAALAIALASALLFSMAVFHPSRAEDAGYASQKVVYHNNGRDGDSTAYFKAVLKNIANHLDAVGDQNATIRVVNHGNGVALLALAMTDQEIAVKIDALRARGVKFLVCENTLKERKIDWTTLYGVKEDDLVTSGVAELVKLQQDGFVYIHP